MSDDPSPDLREFISKACPHDFASFALLKQYAIRFINATVEYTVIIVTDLIFLILNL